MRQHAPATSSGVDRYCPLSKRLPQAPARAPGGFQATATLAPPAPALEHELRKAGPGLRRRAALRAGTAGCGTALWCAVTVAFGGWLRSVIEIDSHVLVSSPLMPLAIQVSAARYKTLIVFRRTFRASPSGLHLVLSAGVVENFRAVRRAGFGCSTITASDPYLRARAGGGRSWRRCRSLLGRPEPRQGLGAEIVVIVGAGHRVLSPGKAAKVFSRDSSKEPMR